MSHQFFPRKSSVKFLNQIDNSTMNIIVIIVCLCTYFIHAQDTELVHTEETSTELCVNGTEDSCTAFNSTEPSTVSTVLEATKTSTPSKKPKTTTPKSVIKKPSPAINTTTPPHAHPDCSCDESQGGCEINCCCDVDCTGEQRVVFTHCLSTPLTVNSDYCFPPHLLHHNNTDYYAVETEPGVLCVLHHNTLSSTDFLDVPVVKSVAALEKKLGRRKYYSWLNPSPTFPVFDVDTSYGSGSPIWISDNSTIFPLVLPAPVGHSSMCQTTMTPLFLEESEVSCTKPLWSKSDCLSYTETQFTVIASPRNFNFTHPQECTEETCLPLHQHICSQSCTERKLPPATFNESNGVCQNVVVAVEYKLYHNGSQGILDAKAFYTVKNISISNDQLTRTFYKVSFSWFGSTDQPVLKRSGKPGYQTSKPVISGRRTPKAVVFNHSSTEWISIAVSENTGHCQRRENLLFGENLRSLCLVQIEGSCKQIQDQIWQQILGSAANLTETVISSYGDPREEPETWVPLLSSEQPPPPQLTTAVDLLLVYSLVGPAAAPQTKIIAAYLNLLPPTLTCDSNLTTVMIETSVRFVDKTRPAVTKFAQPPVYEIKLPQDFFYPFLSAGKRGCLTKEILLIVTAILVFCN